MHRIFFLILLMPFSIAAQPKGYVALTNPSAFQAELKSASANLVNIKSGFKQIKNLSLLEEKIVSQGIFYYQKNDKVRIEYTSPYQYLMIINNGKMLVRDEQKTNRINSKGSKMMQSINRIMIDCMQGSVFENPDFEATAFSSPTRYLLLLQPSNSTMKKMFDRIEVYLHRKNLEVAKLIMIEHGGDYTDMSFSNTKHNTSINDALFKVK